VNTIPKTITNPSQDAREVVAQPSVATTYSQGMFVDYRIEPAASR